MQIKFPIPFQCLQTVTVSPKRGHIGAKKYHLRWHGNTVYYHLLWIIDILYIFASFRSLGVHVSKVRSLTLDAWEPEQIKVNCTVCVFIV